MQDADSTGVSVSEAARRLGISEQAVRQRIRRKTLDSYRVDKTVYVVLSGVASTEQYADSTADNPPDDTDATTVQDDVASDRDELVKQLQSEVAFLREQVHAQQVIILNLTESLKALPAPQEQQQVSGVQHEGNDAQERPQRVWWRLWERG